MARLTASRPPRRLPRPRRFARARGLSRLRGPSRARRVRRPGSLAPLRHRGFRLLAAGQLASNVGDACYAVALPWYVLAGHGGALLLGTVLAAYGIPRTALLAIGGHASDRWRPWTVMMASDTVRALAVAALAVAAALGPARAVILVPIAAVLGAGEGLFLPGSFAIVPALLPDEDLQSGNALASGGTQLATLAGPAVGGLLVALLGPSPAFALDAASFVVSALMLARLRGAARPAVASAARPASPAAASPATASPAGPAAAGPVPGTPTLRGLLRSERVLQVALLITIAANLGSGGVSEVALPALAHGPLRDGAAGYGGLIAAFGAGALLGTLAAGRARRARRPAIAGSFAYLAEAVFLGAVPYLGGTIPAGAALAAFGLLNGFGNVLVITTFQRWAPPALLGRLTGLLMLCSFGVFPVSVVLGAVAVHNVGPAPFFPFAGAAIAIAIVVGLSQRSWREFGAVTPAASRQEAPRRASLAQTTASGGSCAGLRHRRRRLGRMRARGPAERGSGRAGDAD
jgi:MFS family permease